MTEITEPSADSAGHVPDRRAPRSVQALGYRDFRRYWGASIVSNTGSMMYLAVIGWVVEDTTDSASSVTLVVVLGLLPLVVMSPLGGSLADRYSRTKVFRATVIGQMVVAVSLAIAYQADLTPYWALCLFSLAGGIPAAAGAPVQQVLVVELVGPGSMRNAVFMNSTQWNMSRAFGPMLGGLLIELWGPGAAFWFNAVSFVVLLGGLELIAHRPRPIVSSRASLWREFTAGCRYARASPGIVTILVASLMLSVSVSPLQWLAPVIADDAFAVGAGGFGVLLGAFGVGSLIGAVLVLVLDRGATYSRLIVVGFTALSLSVICIGLAPAYALGVVAMACAGASFMVIMPTITSALQMLADDDYRGRVLSLWLMLFGLSGPVSVLAEGLLAEVFGIRAVLIGVAVFDLAFLGALVASRRLAHVDAATIDADQR